MSTYDTYLQVRTNKEDKEEAAAILEQLGTNLSSVVNMLIKQIIITRSVPFEAKLSSDVYTNKQIIGEVATSMRLEGMDLTTEEIGMLEAYQMGRISGDDLRTAILNMKE